jgi:hypothetical protein
MLEEGLTLETGLPICFFDDNDNETSEPQRLASKIVEFDVPKV